MSFVFPILRRPTTTVIFAALCEARSSAQFIEPLALAL